MIGQYLSNTNESATISILQKKLELNKALTENIQALCRNGRASHLWIWIPSSETVLNFRHQKYRRSGFFNYFSWNPVI
jgi:hypothetical protein